ncbi:zinc metalloprotease HtpX [Glycomyces tenuis]|uniref:zinc metalloprotease HtpX n=1 Tax=Glycomyces tenuis TaxID=58116 RepID=UPI000412256C|nr:zinc metalloprotease HtpX [Glycomyces tenuis]
MRHRNGLKTAVLLGALTALVIAIGYAFGGSTGVVIAGVIAVGINVYAYFNSDKIALRSMRARPVSEAQAPQLYATVRELSQRAGEPMPRLYVAPTMQPNAFATGRNPEHAAVAVTEGIVKILTPAELRAVLGHELSHVYNRDILISSVAGALAGIITTLANIAWFIPIFGGDRNGPNPLVLILTMLLGPLAAGLIRMAVSRSREYEADASGARLTGDPLALASALQKISAGVDRMPARGDSPLASEAHLMIESPLRGGFAGLFSTHPPTEQRVARLRDMARGVVR